MRKQFEFNESNVHGNWFSLKLAGLESFENIDFKVLEVPLTFAIAKHWNCKIYPSFFIQLHHTPVNYNILIIQILLRMI